MTLRRTFAGCVVLVALVLVAWMRPGSKEAQASYADPVRVSEGADDSGGNFDDSARRYKNSQARHWRHVVVGTH